MQTFSFFEKLLLAGLLVSAMLAAVPSSGGSIPQTNTLMVFAAASLTEAFQEIGQTFQAEHPDVRVTFNFGGSQNLRAQLEQGARADVFASANEQEMAAAIAAALVTRDAPQIFLTNHLVVILPADNPGRVHALQDLARPKLLVILAAAEVPAGKYARQVLDNLATTYGADFKAKVFANVVSNEDNVKQVAAKIQLGEADAGIVYVSDAVAAPELQTIQIPADANVRAQYPIAVLAAAPHPDLAAAFVATVLSAAGQAILKKWGFTPVVP